MHFDKIQKKQDFFKIRDEFNEVEKYVTKVEVDNRFVYLDFWMDDLFYLSRKYCEGMVVQAVWQYKECHGSDKAFYTCHFLWCVFAREGWDPGLLEKYADFKKYEEGE